MSQNAIADEPVLLSRAELSRLRGGILRRFLTPWRSDQSRIEAATHDDRMLRRRALITLNETVGRQYFFHLTQHLCISLAGGGMLSLTPEYPPIKVLLSLAWVVYTVAGFFCFIRLWCNRSEKVSDSIAPILRLNGRSGWPALDAIATIHPVKAEEALLNAGMDEESLRSLSRLAWAMASLPEGTSERLDGMLSTDVAHRPSAQAKALVARAAAILGIEDARTVSRQAPALLLPSTLDVLGHAGVSLLKSEEDRSR